MCREQLQQKSTAILTHTQSIMEHSSGLLYSKDSEDVNFHIGWIKWYFSHLKEIIEVLDDVEF